MRALEKAYQKGVQEAKIPDIKKAEQNYSRSYLEWIEIPPRPRNCFWSICLVIYGHELPLREAYQSLIKFGNKWRFSSPERKHQEDNIFSDRDIKVLERLELLKGDSGSIVLTDLASETWKKAVKDHDGGFFIP